MPALFANVPLLKCGNSLTSLTIVPNDVGLNAVNVLMKVSTEH